MRKPWRTPASRIRNLAPLVAELRAEGLSLRAIADRLNAEGHTMLRGRPWNAVQLARVIEQAGT
jgi:hypothetical protein